MIGQYKLRKSIEELITLDKFPRTCLLEGEYGCGKHLLVSEISKLLKLDIIDISNRLNLDTIQEVYINPNPYIYLIDSSDISIKEQNVILKFLEEPLKNSYIILLVENKNLLLPTVLNRCQIFTFEGYSQNELSQFISSGSNEFIQYARTPGMILKIQSCPVQDIVQLCHKIFMKISQANYSNILTIPNKLCFNKEPDGKLDIKVFNYILLQCAYELYANNKISHKVYELSRQYYNDSFIFNINKKHLFEHFLIELKLLNGA